MKKFIIILLFLVVLISVCGCVSCAEITSAFANNEYITIYEINAICKNYTSSDIDFLDCYPDGLNDPDFIMKYKSTTVYKRIILSEE